METKTCVTCGKTLPLDQFARANRNKNGRGSRCKPCHLAAAQAWQRANPERHHEHSLRASRKHYHQNPDYYRNWFLVKKYGITLDEYDALLEQQGGGCAICGRKPASKRLSVDHDHRSGRVRGILCDGCNRAIGVLKLEQPERFQRIADYLSEGVIDERNTSRGGASS